MSRGGCNPRWSVSAALVLLLAAGCGLRRGLDFAADRDIKPATIAFHLAVDEPREGWRAMTDRTGRTLYVCPQVELDNADVDVVRALRSGQRGLLQIVFNYVGSRRLYSLTSRHCSATAVVRNIYGEPIGLLVGARLAMLIDDELICAPPIDAPVDGGEVHVVDVFSPEEAERVAAALNRGQ